jgi:hypothetical protein
MRITEIIVESPRMSRLVVPDSYGGFIKIEPNPDETETPTKFSISYINPTMATFYGVNSRILGYDSHGHLGYPQPHFHGFKRKSRDGYFTAPSSSMTLQFSENINLFYGMYFALINRYEQDTKNGTNRTN